MRMQVVEVSLHLQRIIRNYCQQWVLNFDSYHPILHAEFSSGDHPISRWIFRAPHHFFGIDKMWHLWSSCRFRWTSRINSRVQIHLGLRRLIQSRAEWCAHQHWDQPWFLRCGCWPVPFRPTDHSRCYHWESKPQEQDLFHANALHLEPGLCHNGCGVINSCSVVLHWCSAYVWEYAPLHRLKVSAG